jgi:hypothetical protein
MPEKSEAEGQRGPRDHTCYCSLIGDQDTFRFEGRYRVQSRRTLQDSQLKGHWLARDRPLIDSDAVNGGLKRTDLWQGRNVANVKSACVKRRLGAFTEPDALYYSEAFIPSNHSDPFTSDVIDISKLVGL